MGCVPGALADGKRMLRSACDDDLHLQQGPEQGTRTETLPLCEHVHSAAETKARTARSRKVLLSQPGLPLPPEGPENGWRCPEGRLVQAKAQTCNIILQEKWADRSVDHSFRFLNIMQETKVLDSVVKLLGPTHFCNSTCYSKKSRPFTLLLGHMSFAGDHSWN